MKNAFKITARALALSLFLGVAIFGLTVESMAAANAASIEHCGGHGSWGGRGGHGCGW